MYRVFIVDDDTLILEEMIDIVPWAENGFTVVGSSTDAVSALDEISKLRPDVVFCDLNMPVMNGNELISRLRERGVDAECVMISAYNDFENVRTFFKQSGFDYILKPVNLEDISSVLERLSEKLVLKGADEPDTADEESDEALTENPAFNSLILYINEHFGEKITLKDLSEKFNFSETYICRLFQKHYSKSLSLYMKDLRMEKAKELLMDRTILVKEVAGRTGYADYSHFFRAFKDHYGISPNEMRDKAP